MTEESVLDFVRRSFHSVWPLELLLVLHPNPDRTWSVKALAQEIRANASVVHQGLQALTAAGLVNADEEQAVRFEPRSAELAKMASGLIDLYARKPRTVMRAIFSASHDKIQTFSDAFIIRKEPC